jgi:chromosomal replication initiator protein DnaA
MQAELLRLTSQLQSEGKQIVLTSDRPPAEIENLDERLVSRLDGGLVVDIGLPEYETRLAILQRRAEERGADLAPDVLEVVAQLDVDNVRELLGLLNRVVALQAVSENPLTGDVARALLAGEVPAAARPAPASPPRAERGDEFASFLSGVTQTLEEQVDAWRAKVERTIQRWSAEGFGTARLEALLSEGVAAPTERALQEYERDAKRLRTLRSSMHELDPKRADDPVFTDPDRVHEADEIVQAASREAAPPPSPSGAWRFDNFVRGEANSFALDAAFTVVSKPGAQYNPLVLTGPSGVGKTHLLHAIGHSLAKREARVACLSAQQFLDDLLEAIRANKVDVWRSRYRNVGAFLLDDVHLLAGKKQSQEELFNMFNALSEHGKQLVFSLNAPPEEIEGLDARIVSRLSSGLWAPMQPPDRALRHSVVARKLEEHVGESVNADLIDYLAARPADSVRSVVALAQRVLEIADARGQTPDAGLARELVEGAGAGRRRSGAQRTSGVVASPLGGIRSLEKTVWHWPDPSERLIEELF